MQPLHSHPCSFPEAAIKAAALLYILLVSEATLKPNNKALCREVHIGESAFKVCLLFGALKRFHGFIKKDFRKTWQKIA